MKKQAADQSFHDRRYQERKRAEAAKKAPPKKIVAIDHWEAGSVEGPSAAKSTSRAKALIWLFSTGHRAQSGAEASSSQAQALGIGSVLARDGSLPRMTSFRLRSGLTAALRSVDSV